MLSCLATASVLTWLFGLCNGLLVRGNIDTHSFENNFIFVVAKFGFQLSTDVRTAQTMGFVFGNITSASNSKPPVPLTMGLVDEDIFNQMYAKSPSEHDCNSTLTLVKNAFDGKCNPQGKDDVFRKVPCPSGELCVDEDAPDAVQQGFQFTFRVTQKMRPRYWYLFVVPCQLEDCSWEEVTPRTHLNVEYKIWLVNGAPDAKYRNPFEHQFSFDEQDLPEIYLAYFLFFSVFTGVQVRSLRLAKSSRSRFLLVILALQLTGLLLSLGHILIFSGNGVGLVGLEMLANFVLSSTQLALTLLLLLLAAGWTLQRRQTTWHTVVAVWALYAVSYAVLNFYQTVLHSQNLYNPTKESWPVWCRITLRLLLSGYFILLIRMSVVREYDPEKQSFLVHFGAGFTLWFAYRPLLAAFAYNIPEIWRLKTKIAIDFLADSLACGLLIHLFWPRSSNRKYLTSDSATLRLSLSEELDDFEREVLFSDAIDPARCGYSETEPPGTSSKPETAGRLANSKDTLASPEKLANRDALNPGPDARARLANSKDTLASPEKLANRDALNFDDVMISDNLVIGLEPETGGKLATSGGVKMSDLELRR